MGHNEGQALEYGHVKEANGIEGLELLDEHFAAMRKEANGGISDDSGAEFPEEDDEAGWENWDMESEASDGSSGWEEVSEGGDEIELSDSEDDEPKRKKAKIMPREKEDEAEDEDVDMDDDTKSVVSAAPSGVTDATKKLSLLAQQKVSSQFQINEQVLTYPDPDTCRFRSPERTPTQGRQRLSRHNLVHLCQT
jgi:protein SDA1